VGNGNRVLLGEILGAHGLRGEVRLKSFTSDPVSIGAYGAVELGDSGRSAMIRRLRPSKDAFIAVLEGVSDRTAAEALKGSLLYVPRDRLPPPSEDEVYVTDIVGSAVFLKDGRFLGEVAAISDYGAGDLLEIKAPAQRHTFLIPFVGSMVPEVDIAHRRIVVDPPEGLIEAQEQPG
jgi:16S rRNA processing protein RimM